MSNTNQKTVSVIQNRLTAMSAGFTKDLTAKQSLLVEGTSMLQPAILAELAADLLLITEVEAARAVLAAKVAAKKAGTAGTLKFLSSLETSLKVQFGSGNVQLQDFGIKPPKAKKVLTAEQKALAVAAAKDTKAARGIVGSVQRAKITTQGKPGLAMVDAQGNVVASPLTGPTPPGSGTPVAVNAVPAAESSTTPATGK